MAAGVTLLTLDGTKMGNAIIVKEVPPHPAAAEYMAKTNQKNWLVETDFGNRMTLTTNEIHEFYGLGFQQDYDKWWDDRLDLIRRTVE
jgi:hypothetical protein